MDDLRMTHDLDAVTALMAGAPCWWAIGGGWAIDLHLGEPGRRPHKDVDLICLAPDAPTVQRHLAGWDLHRVIDGTLEPWPGDLAPAHQAWVRPSPDDEWAFEVLFEQVDGEEWRFRRNPTVSLPIGALRRDIDGIPTVHLGVALIYKAKRDEDLDVEDLLASLPALAQEGRAWLADAVRSTHGPDHRWVSVLEAPAG